MVRGGDGLNSDASDSTNGLLNIEYNAISIERGKEVTVVFQPLCQFFLALLAAIDIEQPGEWGGFFSG